MFAQLLAEEKTLFLWRKNVAVWEQVAERYRGDWGEVWVCDSTAGQEFSSTQQERLPDPLQNDRSNSNTL